MPVFGADPDEPTSSWEEAPTPRRVRMRNSVYEMVNYFSYHPQMRMSMRCEEQDKAILARLFSRLIDKGFSTQSLKLTVDRFFQTWGGESKVPALAYASSKMQTQLLAEAEIVKDDPHLQWVLFGMPTSPSPFDSGTAKHIRNVVSQFCGDTLFRYPDVVADILSQDMYLEASLVTLGQLVDFHNGTGSAPESASVQHLGSLVHLPEELCSTTRKHRIRPIKASIHEAVAAIPLRDRQDRLEY